MLRKWILIFGLVLSLSFVWAQGSEDFTNSNATTSYADGSFVGNGGITWTYGHSRDQENFPIDGNGLMLRRASDSYLMATIPGGIGEFSFEYRKAYTGTTARQLEFYVNDVVTGTTEQFGTTSVADSTVHTFTLSNINTTGNVTIKIKNVGSASTNRQTVLDNISWTGYTGGGNALPIITNIVQTPSSDITPSTSVSVSANVTDADGTIASVQLKWGTVAGLYPNTINMSAVGSTYTTVSNIPAQANGSTVYYVIQATDNEAGTSTSPEGNYSVSDPATATLPFTHDFADGWGDIYTYSVDGSNEWLLYGGSASMNGYNSDLEEDWMILPALNFNNYSNEVMNFNTLGTYGAVDATNYLKLYWSSNYAGMGDPTAASWTEIPFTLATIGAGLAPSGDLDLSGISGANVHLAFKYHSTDNATRWEVSGINIFTAGTPIISTLPSALTGLNYVLDAGPSAIQSFVISGSNLSADVILTPQTNFQISLLDGASFMALNSITLSPAGGTLAATTIYVRLKAGLPIAAYNEQIAISSTGAGNSSVSLSGAVTGLQPIATILQRPAQIDIADASYQSAVLVKVENYPSDDAKYRLYNDANQYDCWNSEIDDWVTTNSYSAGPSVPGTPTSSSTWWIPFQIGSNPTTTANYRDRLGPLYATPNHQTQALPAATAITTAALILDSQVNFTTWNDYTQKYIVLAYDAVTAGNLIAAASTDLSTGAFSVHVEDGSIIRRLEIRDVMNGLIESVTGSWPQILNTEIVVTGDVDPLYNIAGMPGEEIGMYHLSGIDLTANIEVVAPEHFELATLTAGPWSSTLSLPPSFDAQVYVRINSAVVGEHTGDIAHNSTGAALVNVRVEGETFPATGEIIVTQSLVAFSQELGTPSAAQSYSLQGSGLTGPITVTAQSPFELSANGTSGWAASQSFVANYNGLVYIRLNASVPGTFSDVTIDHISPNTTSVSFMVSGVANPPAGDVANLFFSEYIEGSGHNKALEIFNAEGSPVDLSGYKVKLASNGNPWGNTLELSGTLAAGDVYVIANAQAIPAILALADVTSNVTFYNGDDALGLFYGETLIDVIGIPEESTVRKWDVAGVTEATLDHTLIRKATVTQGNVNWPLSAGTDADDSEWIVMPIDHIDNLGVHTFGSGVQYTAAPVFDPVGGTFTEAISVSLSSSTPSSAIRYTLDGSVPAVGTGTIYTGPIPIAETTTIKAIAYATGLEPSAVVSHSYTINIAGDTPLVHYWNFNADIPATNVNWDQPINATQGSGQLTYSFANAVSFGGTPFNGIDGEVAGGAFAPQGGTDNVNNGEHFELIAPTTGYGDISLSYASRRTSSGFSTHEILYSLNGSDFISKEIVDISAYTNNWVAGQVVTIDFSGIPAASNNPNFKIRVVLNGASTAAGNNRFDNILIDGTAISGGTLDSPVVTIVRSGNNVNLSWNAITNASSYRIESSNDPYTNFSPAGTTGNTAFSITATPAMKFFRVIALP